jgi:nucleoid-associated protein YgaU
LNDTNGLRMQPEQPAMPRQVGLSVLLSLALILVVALGLAGPSNLAADPSRRSPAPSRPEPIVAAGSLIEAPAPTRPPQALPAPTVGVPWSSSDPASAPARPWTSSCGPFTEVRSGESLADVARRVYGDPAAVSHLVEANRDQSLDALSPLHPGNPLRTP